MCEVIVPMPREVCDGLLAVLVRGEEARVRRARAHHHRRHAADRPATNKHTISSLISVLFTSVSVSRFKAADQRYRYMGCVRSCMLHDKISDRSA